MVGRLDFSLVYSCAALLYRQTPPSDRTELHKNLLTLSNLLSTSSHQLQKTLENPLVSAQEKKEILETLLPQAPFLINFLHLMIQENLAATIPLMLKVFQKIYWEKEGFIESKVTTATALEDGFKAEVDRFISRQTGKQPLTQYYVDPSLVAGAKIQMGYALLDTTLKTQFSQLRQCMKGQST